MSGDYNFGDDNDGERPTQPLGWYCVAFWVAFAIILTCLL